MMQKNAVRAAGALTSEVRAAICARLAAGESLRSICRDEAMPDKSTVFRRLKDDGAFSEAVEAAKRLAQGGPAHPDESATPPPPIALSRSTILLCREGQAWAVYELDRNAQPFPHTSGANFCTAYGVFLKTAFPRGAASPHHMPDLIQTSRDVNEVLADPAALGPHASLYCPEGGTADLAFWAGCSPGGTATARFHMGELQRRIEERNVTFFDKRTTVNELEVRRDWRAVAFNRAVQERQAREAIPHGPTPEQAAAELADKEQCVRRNGIHSPHFQGLYGGMPPMEFDALWKGWQAERLQAHSGASAAA